MKITTKLVAGMLAAAVCVAGCGKQEQGGAKPVIKLTYSVCFPPTHVQAKLASEWAEEIKKRTGGLVQITVFSGESLTKAGQCYQGVVDGVSDIGMSAFAYTSGRFPLLEGLDLPVGYSDGVVATRIANKLAAKYNPAETRDVKLLYAHAQGPAILASKRPVATLADMKGLKVSTTGYYTNVVDSLGGSPVSLPQGETYEALLKGVVDATFCPLETLKGWKLGEGINCVTDCRCIGCTTVFFVAMNKGKWKKLPAEVQMAFEAVNAEWVVKHGQAWKVADSEGMQFIKEFKRDVIPMTISEQALWTEKVAPLLKGYAARAGKKNLQGEAFLKDLQAEIAAAREARSK